MKMLQAVRRPEQSWNLARLHQAALTQGDVDNDDVGEDAEDATEDVREHLHVVRAAPWAPTESNT